MEQLIIKEITFKEYECKRTKKEFDNGASPVTYSVIIKTNIPKGYNPMGSKKDVLTFIVYGLKSRIELFYQIGYHIGNDDLILESQYTFESNKQPNIKAYY